MHLKLLSYSTTYLLALFIYTLAYLKFYKFIERKKNLLNGKKEVGAQQINNL